MQDTAATLAISAYLFGSQNSRSQESANQWMHRHVQIVISVVLQLFNINKL